MRIIISLLYKSTFTNVYPVIALRRVAFIVATVKADRHWATLQRNLGMQPLHVMVRHCIGCVAGLHAIVARQSFSVSFRLKSIYSSWGMQWCIYKILKSYKHVPFWLNMTKILSIRARDIILVLKSIYLNQERCIIEFTGLNRYSSTMRLRKSRLKTHLQLRCNWESVCSFTGRLTCEKKKLNLHKVRKIRIIHRHKDQL